MPDKLVVLRILLSMATTCKMQTSRKSNDSDKETDNKQ